MPIQIVLQHLYFVIILIVLIYVYHHFQQLIVYILLHHLLQYLSITNKIQIVIYNVHQILNHHLKNQLILVLYSEKPLCTLNLFLLNCLLMYSIFHVNFDNIQFLCRSLNLIQYILAPIASNSYHYIYRIYHPRHSCQYHCYNKYYDYYYYYSHF